jgi:hypothetical protein
MRRSANQRPDQNILEYTSGYNTFDRVGTLARENARLATTPRAGRGTVSCARLQTRMLAKTRAHICYRFWRHLH